MIIAIFERIEELNIVGGEALKKFMGIWTWYYNKSSIG